MNASITNIFRLARQWELAWRHFSNIWIKAKIGGYMDDSNCFMGYVYRLEIYHIPTENVRNTCVVVTD